MSDTDYSAIFTDQTLRQLFPASLADQFFEALYGDATDGAYDIVLAFKSAAADRLDFEFELRERPGKCLACNLTYGLPEVFSRHPLLNVKGVVANIEKLLAGKASCAGWKLGRTNSVSRSLHTIPLTVSLT